MAVADIPRLEYTLDFPEWAQPLFEPHRYKVPRGGRGSTKSWTVARALLWYAGRFNERILCTRELQTSITESVHRLLCDQIDAMYLTRFFEIQQNAIYRKPYYSKDPGSEFLFYGIKNNPTKIKSTEGITKCWVEEAEKISESSWTILIPTIRVEGSEIWITFNPDEESDPTYQRFVVNPPPDCVSIVVNWTENPWWDTPSCKVLRDEKEYLYRVDPEAADHVWGGMCRRNASSQIFRGKYTVQDFIPHVGPDIPSNQNWDGPYFGADWGFSQDPVAISKIWIDSRARDEQNKPRPRLYVEYAEGGVGIELDNIGTLFKRIPGVFDRIIRGDSSRPETIAHVAAKGVCENLACDFVFNKEHPEDKCPLCGGKARYLRIEAAEKWKGSVEDGIAWLKTFQIVFHTRCAPHIQEARLYSYKVDRLTNEVTAEVVDKHNHWWDADRYACQPMIMSGTSLGKWARL